MTTTTINRAVVLEWTTCCECTIVFAAPEDWLEHKRENGSTFYCPNGHTLVYTTTRLDEMKKRAERAEAREVAARDQRDAAERSNTALRGVVTRAKKRAANGVCPCCKRSFQNLHRHMQGQHPSYATGAPA